MHKKKERKGFSSTIPLPVTSIALRSPPLPFPDFSLSLLGFSSLSRRIRSFSVSGHSPYDLSRFPTLISPIPALIAISRVPHRSFLFSHFPVLLLDLVVVQYCTCVHFRFSMVCSPGGGRMQVMARLLASGSFSQTVAGKEDESPCLKTNNNKEQDRFLPIANVGRIMKKVMTPSGKISKDAKETVQECVSEFISFVTCEASDKCQREKRKTINGDDIIWAITTLGFEDYVEPLKSYLQKYRDIEGEKANIPKQQRPQHQHQQDETNNQPPFNAVYTSTNLINSHPPYLPNDQQFSLPFSPNSIHNHLPPQDQIDQWYE
ncbi:hypothetical protein RJT34_03128 [Clitoria ternatea]|uniref:Transcription factor CBF/NF-Y/archaeal histone domain-containing protein n=1 Tax=Clitoria ternatea TaxID=43366 RepID=A0AAN9KLN6_CLITE